MRQIRVCARLLVASLALAACGGEQFSTGSEPTASGAGGRTTQLDTGEASGTAGTKASNAGGSASSSGGAAKGGSASAHAGAAGGGGTSVGAASSGGGASSGGDTAQPPGSDGGSAVQDCANGHITFRMLPSTRLEQDYLCDAGCGTGWLTITDAQGASAFSISSACGTASCETCEVQSCGAAACLPTVLTAKGTELVWTGMYLAKDTCGDHMACQRQDCVKPGKYKARACAALNQGQTEYGCLPKDEQLCAEVEFDFPGQSTVDLVLEK